MSSFYIMPRVITQGSIINCCVADNYHDCQVNGIVITPRCDLAHDGKVSFVHYLPIIDFKDWILKDGKDYLFARWFDNKKSKFEKQCKQYSIPSNISSKDSYEKMAAAVIKVKNNYSSFMDSVNAYFGAKMDSAAFLKYIKGKDAKNILIDNLSKDSLPAYYLVEDWEKDSHSYKIILLRELKRIGYKTATLISKGVKANMVNQRNDDLRFIDEQQCYIQTQVASPFIEHIMQRFSYNFCRIGVDDRNKTQITEKLTQIINDTL